MKKTFLVRAHLRFALIFWVQIYLVPNYYHVFTDNDHSSLIIWSLIDMGFGVTPRYGQPGTPSCPTHSIAGTCPLSHIPDDVMQHRSWTVHGIFSSRRNWCIKPRACRNVYHNHIYAMKLLCVGNWFSTVTTNTKLYQMDLYQECMILMTDIYE